jgi:predicted amidophosphoribosyltransferase
MPITAQGLDDSDDDDEIGACPECGAEVYLIAARCPKCGYWFTDEDRGSPDESRIHGKLRTVTVVVVVLIAIFVLSAIVAIVAN